MIMTKLKLIGVSEGVKERLDVLGTRKDTYNSIIERLLDEREGGH